MAYVIGLATKEEIERVRKAGYDTEVNLPGKFRFLGTIDPLESPPDSPLAETIVWVDCGAGDLLELGDAT